MSTLAQLLMGVGGASTEPVPTEPGTPYGGGFYVGKIKVGADTYLLIDGGKESEVLLRLKTSNTATPGTSSFNDGWANCLAMSGPDFPAVEYCRNYRGGGFDDWYLGARDEQEVRYRNLKPDSTANITTARPDGIGNHGANANSVPIGAAYTASNPGQTSAEAFQAGGAQEFTVPTYYWTSTEYAPPTLSAWIQRFSDGLQSFTSKGNARLVRPVRRIRI